MRPAPPDPNTSNDGRVRKYRPLVEPASPLRTRGSAALLAAGGFAAAVAIDVALRIFA